MKMQHNPRASTEQFFFIKRNIHFCHIDPTLVHEEIARRHLISYMHHMTTTKNTIYFLALHLAKAGALGLTLTVLAVTELFSPLNTPPPAIRISS